MSAPADPPRGDGSAGFTLVELLVASAMLGLVAMLIVNGMRFVRKAIASADTRRESVEATVTGLGLAQASISRALPVLRKVENRDELLFEGSEERLRFVTTEPDYLPGWPLVAYEYAVAFRGGRYLLDVRRAAVNPGEPAFAGLADAGARTLLAFPGPVRFAYYGRPKPRDAGAVGWRLEWREAELLPEAVRLGPPDDEPGWPDFVVPLMVNTPAACLNPTAREVKGCG